MPTGDRRVIGFGVGPGTISESTVGWDWTAPLRLGPAHAGSVCSVVAVEVAGRTLFVSGSSDRTVRRWDAATGRPVGKPLTGHTGRVWSVAAVEVGGRVLIVSGSDDETVRRWDAATGEPVGVPLTGHTARVLSVATVEVGGRALIVSGSDDETVRRWDAATGEPVGVPLTGHTGRVWSVATVQVGGRTLILSGSSDRTVRRWDAATGRPVGKPLTGHTGRVWSVAAAEVAGRTLIVSGSIDKTVRRWDAATGEPVGDPLTGHTDEVNSVATVEVADRTLIVSGSADKTVRRWDAATGEPVGDPLTGHTDEVNSVATVEVAGQTLIVSGGDDHTVRRWDAATGRPVGKPLTGHTGGVWSVVAVEVAGRTLIVSGGDDRTVRRWDAATGRPVGKPLTGHTGGVWSVVAVEVAGRTLIVSGSADRTVRRWDAATGEPVGDPLTGHSAGVDAVTTAEVAGRTLIVSGSIDKTVRRWDAATGRPVGDPLTGHSAGVDAVTTAEVAGRTLIVSGSIDKTVRRWDAATGRPVGDPLTGHSGGVDTVTTVHVAGRTLIVSGSADRTVRRWDAATGRPVGDPLTGHSAGVNTVATVGVAGHDLIVSGSADRTVRRWDAATGRPVGDPLTGHSAGVNTVTAIEVAGRTLIISGSADQTLVLWPLLVNGQVAGEAETGPRTRTLSVVDDEDNPTDVLGRGVLAAHLDGLLAQLVSKQRAGTAVVHIDGLWGSGKSTLVALLTQRMTSPPDPPPGPAEPEAGRAERLAEPVVVCYDAWRESAVAPEWWSLARAVNVAVRSQRAAATRVVMTISGAVVRAARSRPVLAVAAVLVGLLWARWAGLWAGSVQTLSTVLTAVTAVAGLVLALGRVLFWSSPALGRLHQRAEDNPLGEIAALVASLRRWSPRSVPGQRVADTLLTLAAAGIIGGYLLAYRRDPRVRHDASAIAQWLATHTVPLAAVAVTVILIVGSWMATPARGGRSASTSRTGRGQTGRGQRRRTTDDRTHPHLPHLGRWRRIGRVASLLGAAVTAYIAFSTELLAASSADWMPTAVAAGLRQHPLAWAAGAVASLLALYAVWTCAWLRRPRRPVLLVIDDLDRCSAERVVKLLETVHTLLREPAQPRLLSRWRCPAPLIVLVLADGRWVRTAFETTYPSFDRLGSPVHGLGADFIQKLFDHTVVVPALAADQVQTYLDHLTDTSPWAAAGRRTPTPTPDPTNAPVTPSPAEQTTAPGPASAAPKPPQAAATDPPPPTTPAEAPPPPTTDQAERLIADSQPGDVHSEPIRHAIDRTTGPDRQRLAEQVAAKAASPEAVAAFSEDLLTRYAALMPANPRLVKRVANAFGMLLALDLHLGHHADTDTIARAAIMLIRFPKLVDELLTEPDPPTTNPQHADHDPRGTNSPWLRRDVQQLLRPTNGNPLNLTAIASCYGRTHPPPPITTTTTPAPPSPNGYTTRPEPTTAPTRHT